MNNELTHYGMLGMKWGVRKKQKGSPNGPKRESSENKPKTNQSSDGVKTNNSRNKPKQYNNRQNNSSYQNRSSNNRERNDRYESSNRKKSKTKDPSKMNYRDLENEVKRKKLEKQHKELNKPMSNRVKIIGAAAATTLATATISMLVRRYGPKGLDKLDAKRIKQTSPAVETLFDLPVEELAKGFKRVL